MNSKDFMLACSNLFSVKFKTSELVAFNNFIKKCREEAPEVYMYNILENDENVLTMLVGPSDRLGIYAFCFNKKDREIKVAFKSGDNVIINNKLLLAFSYQVARYSHVASPAIQIAPVLEKTLEMTHNTPGLIPEFNNLEVLSNAFSGFFNKLKVPDDEEDIGTIQFIYQLTNMLEVVLTSIPFGSTTVKNCKKLIIELKKGGLKLGGGCFRYTNWLYEYKEHSKRELNGFVTISGALTKKLSGTTFNQVVASSSIVGKVRRFSYVNSSYDFNEKLEGEITRLNDKGEVVHMGFYKNGKKHGVFNDYLHKRYAVYENHNKVDGGKL